jgi:hypothetical protein
MPLSTPIEVIPIWTVDKNRVGWPINSKAARAPAAPASSMATKRALRLEDKAISAMAKPPLRRVKPMISSSSIWTSGSMACG